MIVRALITDLDNTLYDWVTFFALSFDAMVAELVRILSVDRQSLLSEFKQIHQRYGSTETPWAALELPSVRMRFPDALPSELAQQLEPAFRIFSTARKNHLALYEGVAETLARLVGDGVMIIGHTEALPVNAFYRLTLLGVAERFSRLYTIEGKTIDHPFPERLRSFPSSDLIRTLSPSERKPNPAVLLDICKREGLSPEECLYVGDSLIRDVAMAKQAGVLAVWARYGTRYDVTLWNLLVAVTHWTSADVEREAGLKESFRNVQPDFTIDRFDELLSLFNSSNLKIIGSANRAFD
jgi:FMN phosphatase YigB (HAD superfamily)